MQAWHDSSTRASVSAKAQSAAEGGEGRAQASTHGNEQHGCRAAFRPHNAPPSPSASVRSAGTLAGALSAAATSQLPANQQLALRLAANCFRHAPTRGWLLSSAGNLQQLIDAFASCASPSGGNKAVRLSLATFLGNVAAAAGLKQLHAGQQDVPLQVGLRLSVQCRAAVAVSA